MAPPTWRRTPPTGPRLRRFSARQAAESPTLAEMRRLELWWKGGSHARPDGLQAMPDGRSLANDYWQYGNLEISAMAFYERTLMDAQGLWLAGRVRPCRVGLRRCLDTGQAGALEGRERPDAPLPAQGEETGSRNKRRRRTSAARRTPRTSTWPALSRKRSVRNPSP